MAGTTSPTKSAFPFGDGSNIPIHLRSSHTGGDTSGFKKVSAHKAEYDFKVKKARFFVREGSVAITGGIQIKILDDTGTPQTIVAAFNITAAHDAGAWVDLTVADEGPILTGGVLELHFDSNTSDTIADLDVELLIRPEVT